MRKTMSNVIDFMKAAEQRRRRQYAGTEEAAPEQRLGLGDTSVTATLLLENLDNPHLALEKADEIVGNMPDGLARDYAAADVEKLRARLMPDGEAYVYGQGPEAA
jgi:hypothetical protein